MLRCTIEIVPFGFEAGKRVIEIIEMANISDPPDADPADYACILLVPDSLPGPVDRRTSQQHDASWERFISSIGRAINGRVDGDQPTKAPPTEAGKQRAIAYVHGHRRSDGAAKLVSRAIEALDWSQNYGKRSRKRKK